MNFTFRQNDKNEITYLGNFFLITLKNRKKIMQFDILALLRMFHPTLNRPTEKTLLRVRKICFQEATTYWKLSWIELIGVDFCWIYSSLAELKGFNGLMGLICWMSLLCSAALNSCQPYIVTMHLLQTLNACSHSKRSSINVVFKMEC